MEVYKLKTELDSSQVTNMSLKETIALKENDIRILHDRIIDVSYLLNVIFKKNPFFDISISMKQNCSI